MRTTRRLLFILGFVSVGLLLPRSARAETINCTAITTLPSVITIGGVYCLTGDLSTAMTSGNAIDIQTNNVVLDLNGHKLGGLAAGPATHTYGIHSLSRKNITIRNGTVRGFFGGIFLEDVFPTTASQGHLIEEIRADLNTYYGFVVYGQGIVIRNNQVVGTGGSTFFSPNVSAFGIYADGAAVSILNNDVVDTVPTGTFSAFGIYAFGGAGNIVENNRVTNLTLPVNGSSIGIEPGDANTKDCLVVNNRLTTLTSGIVYAGGATGKYRDNLTSNVSTPYTNGTSAGNNN